LTSLDLALKKAETKEPLGLPLFYHVLEIAKLARDVRAAQIVYFSDRTQANLIDAKRLEAVLDAKLAEDVE
jgi:hypothetical protein